MRAVVQRVTSASVSVDGLVISQIGPGFLLLVAVLDGDTYAEVDVLVDKVTHLRVFADEEGKMNRSALDNGSSILVVSQFTLAAEVRSGRRPSFAGAAPASVAKPMMSAIADQLRFAGLVVAEGVFGERMDVELVNSGPVTIVIDVENGVVR